MIQPTWLRNADTSERIRVSNWQCITCREGIHHDTLHCRFLPSEGMVRDETSAIPSWHLISTWNLRLEPLQQAGIEAASRDFELYLERIEQERTRRPRRT